MVSSAGLIVSLLSVFLPAALAYTSDAVKQNSALFDVPLRPLQPPFPNGCCGGTVVTLPPEDTFAIDCLSTMVKMQCLMRAVGQAGHGDSWGLLHEWRIET